jgi:hypothetical protein
MFKQEQKALALEFARSLSMRSYEKAYGMLSANLQSLMSLNDVREQFESMIPLDWGEVDPLELNENPAWDEKFLYVVLGGDVYSEAIVINSFITDGTVVKINSFDFGRP